MSLRLRLVALLALVVTSLSACVVVPYGYGHRRGYYAEPSAVIVAPYPRYYHGGRW